MGSSFDTKGMCSVHYKTCQDSISYITLLVRIFKYRDVTQSDIILVYGVAQFTKFWKKGFIFFDTMIVAGIKW